MKRPFVLSGGGARGFAHIGVLQAFAEQDIYPEVISATSAGSIAAAFICDGYTPEETADIFREYKLSLSFRLVRKAGGLLSLKFIEQFLNTYLRSKNFESLRIPLYITATNFIDGTQQVFNSGELIPVILAASSIPVIFPPVFLNDIPYVDGGLSNNLPVEPLSGRYADIIGVHVNPLTDYNRQKNGILSNLARTLHFSVRGGILNNIRYCSVFIEPLELKQYSVFDVQKFDPIYQIGLQYTRHYLATHPIRQGRGK